MAHPRERGSFNGPMSRRDFIRRSAGTAFALSGAGALLAACGHASNPNLPAPTSAGSGAKGGLPLARQNHPVKWPIYPDNEPIASGLSPESNATLKIYNWDSYLYKKVVKDFCKEFNCDFELSTFGGVDEALAKMRTGQVDFDIYFPDPSLLGKLVVSKLIRPINLDYVPNLKNVWPRLQDPFYDVGSQYTVPYVIYTTGIAWRNDKVSDDIAAMSNPYEIYWNPKYKGKIHVFDDYRESIGMGLLKNGITDLNTEDQAKIQTSTNDLLKLKDLVNVKLDIQDWTDLPEGISWIHQSWSGDMVSAQYYMPKGVPVDVLSYWYPPQGGGAVGSDLIALPKNGKNPVLAHLFLNWMLDPEQAYSNFVNYVGYQPPQTNIDADRLVSDGAIPKNLASTVVREADLDNGYIYLELSPSGDALWHSAYQQFAAGG
jgi:spermidine/putrescine transport system substrate-binding protein